MNFSSLVDRISTSDNTKSDPWEIHDLACTKADAGEDIVFLSIGQEVDEVTPELVVQAAVQSLQEGDHHYTDVKGSPALLHSIANYHSKLTGQAVTAANCTAYAGAQNALYATAQVLLEAGDEVIVSEPYYTTYAATFSSSGAKLVSVPVTAANHYQLHTDDIIAAISANTRAIVLNTPNNPMGTSYSKNDFQTIVNICIAKQIWLVLDTVYLDIVDIDKTSLPHSMKGAEDILITIGSLSKSHRMTGWRVGWAVAPKKVSEHYENLSMCMHYGLAPFIMKAASVAMEQATNTPTTVRNTLSRRRALAKPILETMHSAKLHDSGQGMFMLIDVSPLNISAHEFSIKLLTNHQVAVLPCDGFGQAGHQLVRVGLCVDDEKLSIACQKIVDCVASFST